MSTQTFTHPRPVAASAARTRRRQSLGAAPDRSRRHVHGRAGLLHRQRRPAVDPVAAPRLQRRARVDRRRLRPHLGGVPDHRRQARRPLRPPPRVLRRLGAVHAQLGRLRGRPHAGGAGAGPLAAGMRRGAADAQRAVADRRPLRRRRPRPGPVGLRDDDGPGRRLGPAHRRDPGTGRHRRPGLAQLLSDQCPDRRLRPGRRPRDSRVTGPAPGTPGRGRHRADHRRPDRDRPAAGGGAPARLAAVDLAVAGRGARDPGRVRRSSSDGWPAGAARRC